MIGLGTVLIGLGIYEKIGLYLHLVNLPVMSGWISSNYVSWGNGGTRQAPQCWKACYWSPFLLWDSFWASVITVPQPGCVCECVSQNMCKFFCALTCVTRSGLKTRPNAGSEFIKQVWAHLVVIGRRKKGPCVLGTGSESPTKPSITQPCPVQYRTGQHWGEKKHQQQGCFPFIPPYLSWFLANSHNPTAKPLAVFFLSFLKKREKKKNSKHCSELSHSFHFNIRKKGLPWAR